LTFTEPLIAFTRLKIGEVLPVEGMRSGSTDKLNMMNAEAGEVAHEHGLLARSVFERYGAANNGKLGVSELHWLLRDHGIMVDYGAACRTLSGVLHPGERRIDFDGLLNLVAEAGTARRGYTEEVIIVLHCIFNSYDRNKSGLLDRQDCLRLLADYGHTAETADETRALLKLISDCRQAGGVGPLAFDQFLALLRRLNRKDDTAEVE